MHSKFKKFRITELSTVHKVRVSKRVLPQMQGAFYIFVSCVRCEPLYHFVIPYIYFFFCVYATTYLKSGPLNIHNRNATTSIISRSLGHLFEDDCSTNAYWVFLCIPFFFFFHFISVIVIQCVILRCSATTPTRPNCWLLCVGNSLVNVLFLVHSVNVWASSTYNVTLHVHTAPQNLRLHDYFTTKRIWFHWRKKYKNRWIYIKYLNRKKGFFKSRKMKVAYLNCQF